MSMLKNNQSRSGATVLKTTPRKVLYTIVALILIIVLIVGGIYIKNIISFENNLQTYLKSLDEATEYIQAKINEIPEESRYLITAHDAFAYFAEQFGLQVKAIQGVSTDSEIGTKQIEDLATFIVEHKIKAIFVESSVNHKSIEALQEAVKAKGGNVEIGGELYSDSMGDKENNTETYIKTIKANADTIANALK